MKQRPGDQPLPTKNDAQDIQSQVIADIAERRKVGIERYGTALQPNNGRDALRDAYEEAMDLTMYLKQFIVERDTAKHEAKLKEFTDALAEELAKLKGETEKPTAEEFTKRLHEAASDPEWAQVTIKGRNGQKIKVRLVVPPDFLVELEQTADYDPSGEDFDSRLPYYVSMPLLRQRFMGITMRRRELSEPRGKVTP